MENCSDVEDLGLVALAMAMAEEEEILLLTMMKPKRKHRIWVREWIDEKEDNECNTAYKLQRRLLECDHKEFYKMLRMTPETFDFILEGIRPLITRYDTNYRKCITAEERLSLTLKYLGTGESAPSLSEAYRVGLCTVGRIIKDTCRAIYSVFGAEYIKTPTTTHEWEGIVNAFDQRWHYPGCLGAVDGKHVRLSKPWKSGSNFFNYKKFFSINILAIVNSNYEFIYLNVGSEGKTGDGGLWKSSDFYQAMTNGKLNIPGKIMLKGTAEKIDCHLIGDDAFSMSCNLMKPYSDRFLDDRQAIFNYRLSRGRIIVENVFGICANKFRVLRGEISMNPDSANDVILAICTLHNVCRKKCGSAYMPPTSVDFEDNNYVMHAGDWRSDPGNILEDIEPTPARNSSDAAKRQREILADFFVSEYGAVEWQRRCIHNTLENVKANIDYLIP